MPDPDRVLVIIVLRFCPSVSTVYQFGCSFAFDAATVLNGLPDEICASLCIASFRKKLKSHLYTKAYSTLVLTLSLLKDHYSGGL